MNVDFTVFARLCSRSREIVLEEGAPQVLVDVYQAAIEQPLQAFSEAMQGVKQAQQRAKEAEKRKESTLAEIDRLFRMARSAVAAIVPTTVLPDTLKTQPTDTDKREAIQELVHILQEHAGATWTQHLLEGEFGQKAPVAIQQLNAYIEAANALQKARTKRSNAFASGWSAFVKYKRLVRDTLGPSSRQYQRLRLRTGTPSDAEAEPKDEDEKEVTTTPRSSAAPSEVRPATTAGAAPGEVRPATTAGAAPGEVRPATNALLPAKSAPRPRQARLPAKCAQRPRRARLPAKCAPRPTRQLFSTCAGLPLPHPSGSPPCTTCMERRSCKAMERAVDVPRRATA